MAAIDLLLKKRQSGYGDTPQTDGPAARVLSVTPEEMSALSGTKPGEEVVLEVTGVWTGDAVEVASVAPSQESQEPEAPAAQGPMQQAPIVRVSPAPYPG